MLWCQNARKCHSQLIFFSFVNALNCYFFLCSELQKGVAMYDENGNRITESKVSFRCCKIKFLCKLCLVEIKKSTCISLVNTMDCQWSRVHEIVFLIFILSYILTQMLLQSPKFNARFINYYVPCMIHQVLIGLQCNIHSFIYQLLVTFLTKYFNFFFQYAAAKGISQVVTSRITIAAPGMCKQFII